MTDIALTIINDCIDLNLTGGDFEADTGLETAVMLSLFSDQRVAASELPVGDTEKRGWWADLFSDTSGDKFGSKLWLLDRSKRTLETEAAAEVRAKQALKWMIDDGVAKKVTTSAAFDSLGRLQLKIQITRPDGTENRYGFAWDQQGLKRA